jgi:uncharacterized protein (TIGR01777 family)
MPNAKLRIVIPGGSGQVGRLLARHFHAQGDAVAVLTRRPKPAPWRTILWNGRSAGAWAAELEDADVCINLAGRSVNCRYHDANRREIYESRIQSTQSLNDAIVSLRNRPRVWLNASTATIYRHTLDRAGDRPQDEATGELGGNETGAPETWNFSIKVAKDWERAFFATATPRTRKVALRSSMIFSPDQGSVFAVLLGLVRCGLGGAQGSGAQFVSWIHEADFIRAVEFLIEREELEGAVNVASPHPLPNREFMRAFRKAWGIGFGLPATEWMIEAGAFLLRTESELVLKSRRVVPGRLSQAGFEFLYPEWQAAIEELVRRWRQ